MTFLSENRVSCISLQLSTEKSQKYFNLVWVNNPNYSKFTFWAGDDCCVCLFCYFVSHLFTFMLKLKTVCNHHISMNSWLLTLWSKSSSSVELTQIRVRLHSNTSPVRGEGSSYVLIDIHITQLWNTDRVHAAGDWTTAKAFLLEPEDPDSVPAGELADSDRSATSAAAVTTNLSAELMQKLEHRIFVAEGEFEWKLLLQTKTLVGIKQLGKYLNLQTQLQ